MNKIVAENLLAGEPSTVWDAAPAGGASIQGFATEISVDLGESVLFKVDTDATAYRLDVYRLGYYGGAGARKVATVAPSAALPQVQPPPAADPGSGLLDYGTWAVSAEWPVPTDATSGIHLAKLVREDGVAGASHIFFVVRDDSGESDVLVQASDTTWHAYNNYGDVCLYEFLTSTRTRAFKVSYNRPFLTRAAEEGANWVFNAEYQMVRWLEANGYDVSYCAGVDTDRRGPNLLRHRVFLSVGHDEYWSADQRAHVEAARDAGVHLAFLSGGEAFWKVRWEDSIDDSATPYRTLVCYKETQAGAKIDPTPVWTGAWRDPRFSPPSDGGRPENGLTGTMFSVQGFSGNAITVPAEEGRLRFWRDTDIATLAPGTSSDLSAATLGYEWDQDVDNGARPAGLMQLSASTVATEFLLLGLGMDFGPGTPTHHLTLYRHSSGALVFGAGTVQWSWALDGTHPDGTHYPGTSSPDPRAQQAMVNLFADMGIQPESVQPDLALATPSTDETPPSSAFTSPAEGAVVTPDDVITISGVASDDDGVVGAVEVSVDGGLSWHPASGREAWTYAWTPSGNGLVTLVSRAVDDSGNLEAPGPGITVTVGASAPVAAPGGPILVLVNGSYSANPFGGYLSEMLRTEGLMLFREAELGWLVLQPDPLAFLEAFPLVLLAETRLVPAQQDLIRAYVAAGGNLVAMRPDPALTDMFGLSHAGGRKEATEQFFAFDTTSGPGVGVSGESLQYHGPADTYTTAGASVLAAFWDDMMTPSDAPAITQYSAGGGQAVAFAFDLAKSIVLMRQGNPNWADSEGDGSWNVAPANLYRPDQYRAMDMFARTDGQMWFAPERLLIPQADEQQRFLGNLLLDLLGRPVPRVWYLPGTHRRVIVNTGDTCVSSATNRALLLGDVVSYGARVTLYLWDSQIQGDVDGTIEAGWRAAGHDTGVHVYAYPRPVEYADNQPLRNAYAAAVAHFETRYGHGVRSARNHYADWVGWIGPAKIEAESGTQLDLNYYHYWQMSQQALFPDLRFPTNKTQANGYFTGSGLPQRFCDENGAVLPVYQLLTEWPDEYFADNGFTDTQVVQIVKDMLTAADAGYCSAFVTNIHPFRYAGADGTDAITKSWATQVWAHAQAEGIPVWTAARFLDFTQARQGSSFPNLSWDGSTLTFDFDFTTPSNDLTVMVPGDGLVSVTVDGEPITPAMETIAGRSVGLLTALAAGTHVVAQYA